MIRRLYIFILLLGISATKAVAQDEENIQELYDSSQYYFDQEQYSKASPLLERVIAVFSENLEDTATYYSLKYRLGVCYVKTNKAEEGKKILEETIKYYSTNTSHPNYLNSLTYLAVYQYEKGNTTEAKSLFGKILTLTKQTKGEKSKDYISLLNIIAGIEYNSKNYERADSLYTQLLTTKKELYGEKHPETVKTMLQQANLYKNLRKFNLAETHYAKLSSTLKDSLGENNSEYIAVLSDLGNIYKFQKNYKAAESLFSSLTAATKAHYGATSLEYANALVNEAAIQKHFRKFSEAERALATAISIFEQTGNTNKHNYALALSYQASIKVNFGQYSAAETSYLKAAELIKQTLGETSVEYIDLMNNLALLYDETGRFEDAENLYKEVLRITEKSIGTTNPEYATTLNNLAILYQETGHYEQAEPLFKKSMQIRKDALGENHIHYGESLNNLGTLYQKIGRNKEAETLYTQAIEIIKKTLGENDPEYASYLNNLAGLYEISGQLEKAEKLYTQSLAIIKESLGENHPHYAAGVNNLALVYQKNGKYKEAEVLYQKDLDIIKSTLGENHPKYANGLSNLAGLNENMGNYPKAETLYLQAITIRKTIFGDKHPDYAYVINNLARVYSVMGKMDEAEKLWNEALSIYLYQISTYFPTFSEKEKEQFYHTISPKFEQFNSFAIERKSSNPAVMATMFNNQLATKALLLNASNKLRDRILNSGDAILIKDYKTWQIQKEQLAQYYQLSQEELKKQNINIAALEDQVNNLEKELSTKSELFKNVTEKQNYNWLDVQKKLLPREAAVELIRFRKFKADSSGTYSDSIFYAALIVKADTKGQPDFVLLRNGKELEERYIKLYRNSIMFKIADEQAYKQYWRQIKESLGSGITKVYLSPDGVYNQINLYSIQNPETKKYVIDEIEVKIVTNSKDLLENKAKKAADNKIVLLGDPAFYPEGTTTGTLDPLPGTKQEVTKVNQLLSGNKWQGNMFTGTVASEEKIKEAQYPKVLHIATHGFFKQDGEDTKDENDKKSDNVLFKSGLHLAGSGVPSYESQSREDGILYAYEAMNLNLDNTELVVLSACETGLGKVKNGEGVYGLQRAFRVAGARNIIISLWKVDDTATQILMESFYQEWIKTGNKRESFKKAQNNLRTKYADPKYWAAFVMIGE